VALAAVLAIRQKTGYETLDVRVKWPNDIYFGSAIKLGGVVVRSSIMTDIIHANIGCGFNVTNRDPTICVNDLIHQLNNSTGGSLEAFTVEELIGRTVTFLEQLIGRFETEGLQSIQKLYYQYWLHGGVEIHIGSDSGPVGKIEGLDGYGFLLVRLEDGSTVSLHPDDNSFDMMRNLVIHKTT